MWYGIHAKYQDYTNISNHRRHHVKFSKYYASTCHVIHMKVCKAIGLSLLGSEDDSSKSILFCKFFA